MRTTKLRKLGAAVTAMVLVAALGGAWWWWSRADVREMEGVFARYTSGFPRGVLRDDAFVVWQHQSTGWACRRFGPRRPSVIFCAVVDVTRPSGRQVLGSFKFRGGTLEDAPEGVPPYAEMFDCSGHAEYRPEERYCYFNARYPRLSERRPGGWSAHGTNGYDFGASGP